MRVLVTGGTGLVGHRLIPRLLERGDDVVALSRQSKPDFPSGCAIVNGDPCLPGSWLDQLAECDAVVHLAGENVFANRWRKRFKQRLYDSRIDSTKLVAAALAKRPLRADGSPKTFVSASAIGYYGSADREELDEDSPAGTGFLAMICKDWELAARSAKEAGARVSHIRVGMVLDESGGALRKLVRPFFWYLGGPVASGQQWVSWIHVADLVGIIATALDHPQAIGPINGTAPEPLTNWGFSKILGKVMNRPSWLNVPGFLLRIALGEVSSVATTGQRVLPRRALQLGYSFQFPDLEVALRDLLKRPAAFSTNDRVQA